VLGGILEAQVFDADQHARELLDSDRAVHHEITARFGPQAFGTDGRPDRAFLRELVFADSAQRVLLESILHPRIRERWIALSEEVRSARETRWLIVDIPLLYETAVEANFDRVVVIACSESTQMNRLLAKRGLSRQIASKMIQSQIGLDTKIRRADYVIWNDSRPEHMREQALVLGSSLKARYG